MLKSNCLIVALVAWWDDPLHTRIHILWRPTESWCPHVYWCHKGWYAHFRMNDSNLHGWDLLWHEGKIKPFPRHKVVKQWKSRNTSIND